MAKLGLNSLSYGENSQLIVIFAHNTTARGASSGWSRIPELDARSPQEASSPGTPSSEAASELDAGQPSGLDTHGRGGRGADG